MTDNISRAAVEAVARAICEQLGRDPDEQRTDGKSVTWPLWKEVAGLLNVYSLPPSPAGGAEFDHDDLPSIMQILEERFCTCGAAGSYDGHTEWCPAEPHFNPPSPVEGEGWQPIETAPRDGSRLILSDGVKSWVGYWLDNSHTQWPWAGWRVPSMEPEPRTKPTMWHPLLVPPAALSPQSPTGETE